jgi:[acyl-carrier-protein] S-malonyltransferase
MDGYDAGAHDVTMGPSGGGAATTAAQDMTSAARSAARTTDLVVFPGHVLPLRARSLHRPRTAAGDELLGHAARAAGLADVEALLSEAGRSPHRSQVMAPLVVALSLASFADLVEDGLPGGARLIGHSLGELTALAAAGALSAEDAIALAGVSGRALDEAAERAPASGLYVVRGHEVEHALRIGGDAVEVALDNAADEVILGGPRVALSAIGRVVPGLWLRGAPGFHTRMMESARARVEAAIAQISLASPRREVFSAVAPGPVLSARAAGAALLRAVSWRVRFREALDLAAAPGARQVAVVAPGGPVAAVVRRSLHRSEVRELA